MTQCPICKSAIVFTRESSIQTELLFKGKGDMSVIRDYVDNTVQICCSKDASHVIGEELYDEIMSLAVNLGY